MDHLIRWINRLTDINVIQFWRLPDMLNISRDKLIVVSSQFMLRKHTL